MKTIQLKHGIGRYSDVSPFPLGDLELVIEGIPATSGEFRFISKCNGEKCAECSVSAAYNRVTVYADKLAAGRFSCFVSHYLNGVEVKRYRVEDLLITELNGSMTADPEIALLRRKVAALEKQGEALSQDLCAERAAREQAEKAAAEEAAYTLALALGLLRFAYEDFRENVYLHGGTFEEFLKAYDIDLSGVDEERIKEIKGE